jgi:CheY-like chemotaxis protein
MGRPMTDAVEEVVAPTAIERALGICVLQQRDCGLMKSMSRNVSVLLVEDEALIRMMFAGMIEEPGHTVVAEAGNIADALNHAKSADFSVAILDINLGGYRIDPVAEIIDGRGLPFIFASGYGSKGLPEKFCDRPVVAKANFDGAAGKCYRSGVGRSGKHLAKTGIGRCRCQLPGIRREFRWSSHHLWCL